jgi:polysaccharide biosynthesis transport protein
MFKRYGWIPLVLIPVGAIAGLMIASVVTYVMPKIYESQAVIEVKPFADAPVGLPRKTEGEAPVWLLGEIEKMKSRLILDRVSEKLELPNRWGLAKEQVPPMLKKSLNIQSMRGTDLVSIRVRSTSKVDAKDIAEEVAKSYKAYRAELEVRDSEKFQVELNKAVRDQEDKVEERRKVLSTIVRNKGIIYRESDLLSKPPGVDEHHDGKSALQAYHGLEQEKMQLESQLSSLLKYEDDQLMVYASGLDLPENAIKKLYPLYLEAKRELEATKTKGLDKQHPTVLAKVEEIEKMKTQLDEGVVNLRAMLKAKLDLASDHLKRAEAMKVSADQGIKRATDAQDYVDAKREFESEQELLQALKLKQISEGITTRLGREGVEIHEFPVIAEAPVSPNVTMNLVFGTISGLFLLPLLGLPLMWILNRSGAAKPVQGVAASEQP